MSSKDQTLKKCTRCNLIKYCSRNCQRKDYNGHDEMCKATRKLQDDVDYGDNKNDVAKLKRLAYKTWVLADKHDNYEAMEKVLEHLQHVLRCYVDRRFLATRDGDVGVNSWIPFLFLILGKDTEMMRFIQNSKDANNLAFPLARLASQIQKLNELEEQEAKVAKFDKRMAKADPDSVTGQMSQSKLIKDCVRLFLRGNKKHHDIEQLRSSIQELLKTVHSQCPGLLPALANPKAYVDNTTEHEEPFAKIKETKDYLVFSWKYFKRLEGAKNVIQDFLSSQLSGLGDK